MGRNRPGSAERQKVHVGCDRVECDGDARVVYPSRPLADWKPTKFRRTAVVYEETTYYVAEASSDLPYCYRLEPWPDDLFDQPAQTIVYDAALVEQREARHRDATHTGLVAILCLPLFPVLGLLPSPIKAWLEEELQLSAVSMTRQSLRLEYLAGIAFVLLVFAGVFIDAPLGISSVWLPPLAAFALLLDFFIRWDLMNERAPRQYGAFEWIFHRLG